MRKMNNYIDFINEKLFSKVKDDKKIKSRIDMCVEDILAFLDENKIHTWDDFMKMTTFERDIINQIIDHDVENMQEVKEVRFLTRLELSNKEQLKEYLIELEDSEEYEKCAKVYKKINEI
jgi:hypothetical protein